MAVKFKNGIELSSLKFITSPVAGYVMTSDVSGNLSLQAVPTPAGSLVDGGVPTTNHTGNLKVDFGSVT